MQAVIQEDATGCGIASAAVLAGVSYQEMKFAAARLGIRPERTELWTHTVPMRRLLKSRGILLDDIETAFTHWDNLPDLCLLAIKWHMEQNGPAWHWVVFVRENNNAYVLDPKKTLKSNVRTDFGRINPKWFIGVKSSTWKSWSTAPLSACR